MLKKTFILATLIMFFTKGNALATPITPGIWRFELHTSYASIPFIIKIHQAKEGLTGELQNGKETINLSEIKLVDKKIEIPLQTYEISLEMNPPQQGKMEGFLVRHNKNPIVKTPVSAVWGVKDRFPSSSKKPLINLSGRWKIKLREKYSKVENPGVLIFEQEGNKIHGSILTPTGDYRFMSGFISGNQFKAASFDGVYNYLLEGSVKNGKISAKILSNHETLVEGIKDAKADLPNAYQQTQVQNLNFEFTDLKGKKVSLKDKVFKNKPVVVQIFGSWCPNCIDEMNFLIPWYNQNKKRGVEIVALAFERSLNLEAAKRQLLKTQRKKKVPYPILIAGATSEDKPQDKLTGIKNFISFPTTIFLNKKHQVVKVHAGFSGPGTGDFFVQWKKEFNQIVDELLEK